MRMVDFKIGDTLKVVGFESGNSNYRAKLMAMGLIKRAEFTLIRMAPLGDPVELKLTNGGNVTLRKEESNALKVEKV